MLLSEVLGRGASLYHGSGLGGAMNIIRTDTFQASTLHAIGDELTGGVSLTRSPVQARTFGYVVFALDQIKLQQRHRIVPIDYWGQSREPVMVGSGRRLGRYAEAEEFVIGPIEHAEQYITAIYVERKVLDRYQKEYGEQITVLTDHPKLAIR